MSATSGRSRLRALGLVVAVLVFCIGLSACEAGGASSPGDAVGGCVPAPHAPKGTQYRSTEAEFAKAQVWVYGDSISYQTQANLRATSTQSIAVDAVWGRTTRNGIAALRDDLAATAHRPRTLVMALGTNDLYNLSRFAEQVRWVRQAVPASVRLVWVNTYRTTTPHWVDANWILDDAVGVRVLRWAKAVRTSPVPLLDDGTHVTAAGCSVRNGLIRRALG